MDGRALIFLPRSGIPGRLRCRRADLVVLGYRHFGSSSLRHAGMFITRIAGCIDRPDWACLQNAVALREGAALSCAGWLIEGGAYLGESCQPPRRLRPRGCAAKPRYPGRAGRSARNRTRADESRPASQSPKLDAGSHAASTKPGMGPHGFYCAILAGLADRRSQWVLALLPIPWEAGSHAAGTGPRPGISSPLAAFPLSNLWPELSSARVCGDPHLVKAPWDETDLTWVMPLAIAKRRPWRRG